MKRANDDAQHQSKEEYASADNEQKGTNENQVGWKQATDEEISRRIIKKPVSRRGLPGASSVPLSSASLGDFKGFISLPGFASSTSTPPSLPSVSNFDKKNNNFLDKGGTVSNFPSATSSKVITASPGKPWSAPTIFASTPSSIKSTKAIPSTSSTGLTPLSEELEAKDMVRKLMGLNQSMKQAISVAIKKSAVVDLSDICSNYKMHRENLEMKHAKALQRLKHLSDNRNGSINATPNQTPNDKTSGAYESNKDKPQNNLTTNLESSAAKPMYPSLDSIKHEFSSNLSSFSGGALSVPKSDDLFSPDFFKPPTVPTITSSTGSNIETTSSPPLSIFSISNKSPAPTASSIFNTSTSSSSSSSIPATTPSQPGLSFNFNTSSEPPAPVSAFNLNTSGVSFGNKFKFGDGGIKPLSNTLSSQDNVTTFSTSTSPQFTFSNLPSPSTSSNKIADEGGDVTRGAGDDEEGDRNPVSSGSPFNWNASDSNKSRFGDGGVKPFSTAFNFDEATFPFKLGNVASQPSTSSIVKVADEGDCEEGEIAPASEPQLRVKTGAGEESDNTLFESKAKLYVYNPENEGDDNKWKVSGVGNMKINEDGNTKKKRLLMKVEGGLNVILNCSIFKGFKVSVANDGKDVRFIVPVGGFAGTSTLEAPRRKATMVQFMLKLKTHELAKQFADIVNKFEEA